MDNNGPQAGNDEISIFDSIQPLPEYYSAKAINGFSILFSVFFGAIMMAVNFKNTREKKGIWQVLVFGAVYTTAVILIGDYFHLKGAGSSLLFNIPGSFIMTRFFWEKYIGKDVPYKSKSVLIPVIIAVVVFGGILALAFYMPDSF